MFFLHWIEVYSPVSSIDSSIASFFSTETLPELLAERKKKEKIMVLSFFSCLVLDNSRLERKSSPVNRLHLMSWIHSRFPFVIILCFVLHIFSLCYFYYLDIFIFSPFFLWPWYTAFLWREKEQNYLRSLCTEQEANYVHHRGVEWCHDG